MLVAFHMEEFALLSKLEDILLGIWNLQALLGQVMNLFLLA